MGSESLYLRYIESYDYVGRHTAMCSVHMSMACGSSVSMGGMHLLSVRGATLHIWRAQPSMFLRTTLSDGLGTSDDCAMFSAQHLNLLYTCALHILVIGGRRVFRRALQNNGL